MNLTFDHNNRRYDNWTPEDAIAAGVPQEVIDQAIAEAQLAGFTASVQRHLDTTARARGYDGILSLCSYAASDQPRFGAEGKAGVAWRDAVWAACYEIVDAVRAGQRQVPTREELLAELPAIVWPEGIQP